MKHSITILVITLALTSVLFGNNTEAVKHFSSAEISNLNNCIASQNVGVQEWGIYLAGKHRINESVEALSEAYSNTSSESLKRRILFSLYQIDSEKSYTAISEIRSIEETVSLKKLCAEMENNRYKSLTTGE